VPANPFAGAFDTAADEAKRNPFAGTFGESGTTPSRNPFADAFGGAARGAGGPAMGSLMQGLGKVFGTPNPTGQQ
jgi:hypothetical protein